MPLSSQNQGSPPGPRMIACWFVAPTPRTKGWSAKASEPVGAEPVIRLIAGSFGPRKMISSSLCDQRPAIWPGRSIEPDPAPVQSS